MSQLDLSIDAERSLFASVIVEPSRIDRVSEIATGTQFADAPLGRAYDLVIDLYAAGIAVGDTGVLLAELRKAGVIEALGGASGLGTVLRSACTSAEYHAAEVARLHRCRQLRSLAVRIARDAEVVNADPAEITAMIEAQASSVGASGPRAVSTLSEAMERLADRLDDDRDRGEVAGSTTGIDSLDRITGGLMPGELVVIGARTSVGKTAFGMQIALDAALSGRRTLVASLEMQELQLAQRIAASRLGLSLIDQRTGEVSAADVGRIRQYAAEAKDTPLLIMDARRAKMARIRGVARSTNATGGLGLIVVDYLQLISPSDHRKPRYEQVTEVSGDLKSLAMELSVPVVALAQLNRQGEAEKPKLSHLRESGAIEQDADAVWFIHRENRETPTTTLIIAKQRQGMTGQIELQFDGDRCLFTEPAIESHSNYKDEFAEYT